MERISWVLGRILMVLVGLSLIVAPPGIPILVGLHWGWAWGLGALPAVLLWYYTFTPGMIYTMIGITGQVPTIL